MIVLGVLFGSLIVFRLLGFIGVPVFQTWHESMIFALAVMFCFTAVAHFGPMRRDLERMVPPWVPNRRVAGIRARHSSTYWRVRLFSSGNTYPALGILYLVFCCGIFHDLVFISYL